MVSLLSDVLVKNGLIVTMDKERRILRGSVYIEDNEISEVGKVDKSAETVIDAEGKIVMPGLVCAHANPCRTLLKNAPFRIEPLSDPVQLLQRVWWPLDEVLSKESIQAAAAFTCLEFLKSGVTFFGGVHSSQNEIGKSLDHVASAVEKAGLRAFLAFKSSERHTRAKGARGMKENIRFLENCEKNSRGSRINGMVGVDASFLISDELLRHGNRVAKRFDVPFIIPTAESRVDSCTNLKRQGKKTIERFNDLGVLSSRTVLSHCVHVSDEEISVIDKLGASIATDPMDEMNSGSGLAKISEMKDRGLDIGLGTGGYGFNFFENMRSFYLAQKAVSQNPSAVAPMEVLEMATIGGAKAYDMGRKIGSIEPGKRADLILIDYSSTSTPLSRENVSDYLVSTASKNEVDTVMVGGDILMGNRKVKTLDEEKVMEESKNMIDKIWKELEFVKR